MMDYSGKNVLVAGSARSGEAASALLKEQGAIVIMKNISDKLEEEYDIIVQSPGIPLELVENAAPYVIGEFELGTQFYKGSFLAITGTNGKTTTTMLLHHILSFDLNLYGKVNIAGNIGVPLTSLKYEKFPCVVEASSFQLESIKTFKPKIAAVLNISEDHLDRHKTMENYIKAKERIFENQTEEDILILNYKDEICLNMSKKAKSKIIFFNNGEELLFDKEKLKLQGKHNIENVLAATAMAKAFGVTDEVIREAIHSFIPPEHRLEYVKTINGTKFYNDSKATNPNSTMHALNSLKGSITLIAGGRLKDTDYRELIPYFTNVKTIIVYGEGTDYLSEIWSDYKVIKADFNEIVKQALKEDCENVLFSPACASFDLFKDFEERGKAFKSLINLRR
ncbi:MAG: UDP-N-acetylmuramoyl-L-alanine--D-glutamate ligase [Defluviitaleaceae bacterium]|nr:UDP-N-acetylmuramoyl-L-alanine--D-glutamate ligase [Defluviitaleaceae bacterium]